MCIVWRVMVLLIFERRYMVCIRFCWFWTIAKPFACLNVHPKYIHDNTQCEFVYTACYRCIYFGVHSSKRIALQSSKINVILDNACNLFVLFYFKKASNIRICVGFGSKLEINFAMFTYLKLELIADRLSNINIVFTNALCDSNIDIVFKMRARTHAQISVANVLAHWSFDSTFAALALEKRVKLKIVYDVLLIALAPFCASPRFVIGDKHSLFVHAINVSCSSYYGLNCNVYCANRLLSARVLAALFLYSLCIARFD
ncbi:hypothetical protein AADW59_00490 [Candidatus Hodgkinia cicadicola]